MSDLNILAFTDFHGHEEAYTKAEQVISTRKPDFAVVAGDLVNYDAKRAEKFLLQLARAERPIYFVPGNMDNEELTDWTGNENVHPLHGLCECTERTCLIGLGGSPHGPFNSPIQFTESEATELLEKALQNYHGDRLVLVSHCPPKDTRVDQVPNGKHAGSVSVRKFVDRTHPVLVISGHIHEAQGTDTIGSTKLVNTGPAQRGHYAKITLNETIGITFEKLF